MGEFQRPAKPMDCNNKDDDWWPDDNELLMTRFYVNGEWVDEVSGGGLCYR